jgi:hypothetical protein
MPFRFTTASDVWAYGMLMVEVYTDGAKPLAQIPFESFFDWVGAGNQPQRPANCPPAVYAALQQCWDLDSSQRPSFDKLVASFVELGSNLDWMEGGTEPLLYEEAVSVSKPSSNPGGKEPTQQPETTGYEYPTPGYEYPTPIAAQGAAAVPAWLHGRGVTRKVAGLLLKETGESAFLVRPRNDDGSSSFVFSVVLPGGKIYHRVMMKGSSVQGSSTGVIWHVDGKTHVTKGGQLWGKTLNEVVGTLVAVMEKTCSTSLTPVNHASKQYDLGGNSKTSDSDL